MDSDRLHQDAADRHTRTGAISMTSMVIHRSCVSTAYVQTLSKQRIHPLATPQLMCDLMEAEIFPLKHGIHPNLHLKTSSMFISIYRASSSRDSQAETISNSFLI